jgi:hypothetical protein
MEWFAKWLKPLIVELPVSKVQPQARPIVS